MLTHAYTRVSSECQAMEKKWVTRDHTRHGAINMNSVWKGKGLQCAKRSGHRKGRLEDPGLFLR